MKTLHHRKSIRLRNYDYSTPGAYFITICTKNKRRLLGDINNKSVNLNDVGRVVESTWRDLPNHNSNVQLDKFVIMPNHVHGILLLTDVVDEGAGLEPAPTAYLKSRSLSEIIRQFKTFSAKHINSIRNTPGTPVWHRNYYEHVIRSERDLDQIREYIVTNPANWETDEYYVPDISSHI